MQIKENNKNWLLNALIIIFGLVYLSLCFNDNVWTDEAFTMDLIENDFVGILKGTALDVHPPLYYLFAKIAALLIPTYTYRLLVQKIVVIIPMLLIMRMGAGWLKRKYGYVSAWLFVIALGCIPCTMTYAIQVRMYSWALFFVTMCGIKAYECYENNKIKDWIVFAISGVASAYLHNFSFVSALIICGLLFLSLLFKKKKLLIRWGICVIGMAIAYLPWFLVLLEQIGRVNKSYWIPPITWETIWSYFVWAFGTDVELSTQILLGIFILGGIINLVDIIYYKRKDSLLAQIGLFVPLLTTVGGVVVSMIQTPIYFDRYVFPAVGILCISFAISYKRLDVCCVGMLSLVLLLYAVQEYKEVYAEEYLSTTVKELNETIRTEFKENDIVVYNLEVYGIVYKYYFDEDKLYYLEDVNLDDSYNNIWFLDTKGNYYFTQEVLDMYGLGSEYMGTYSIEDNSFDLYKMSRE